MNTLYTNRSDLTFLWLPTIFYHITFTTTTTTITSWCQNCTISITTSYSWWLWCHGTSVSSIYGWDSSFLYHIIIIIIMIMIITVVIVILWCYHRDTIHSERHDSQNIDSIIITYCSWITYLFVKLNIYLFVLCVSEKYVEKNSSCHIVWASMVEKIHLRYDNCDEHWGSGWIDVSPSSLHLTMVKLRDIWNSRKLT